MNAMARVLGKHSDIGLVMLVLGVLIVLFAPIPSGLLDFLILANFGFAFLVLLLTFYISRPVEFSTFPSLLLIATLFRLSLNVAATRLILADGDAGRVIAAIGSFVVGGNYVIGIIVLPLATLTKARSPLRPWPAVPMRPRWPRMLEDPRLRPRPLPLTIATICICAPCARNSEPPATARLLAIHRVVARVV